MRLLPRVKLRYRPVPGLATLVVWEAAAILAALAWAVWSAWRFR